MSKILSQDEIDELLRTVEDDSDLEAGFGAKKAVLYDFKHPNLISKEQFRLLNNIHENFARDFSVYLSSNLHVLVEINLLDIDQFFYSEFVMSISPPGCLFVIDFEQPADKAILDLSPQLAIFIVEKLFGGLGDYRNIETRPITVIEQKIMTRIVNHAIHELEKNWSKLIEIKGQIFSYESNPEFVQIVPASAQVIVVSMEVVIKGFKTIMNFCYPYLWLNGVMAHPDLHDHLYYGHILPSEEEIVKLNSSLNDTETTLAAKLGNTKITIRDFLNMNRGDVLVLDSKVSNQIPVFVQNRHTFDAIPGTSDNSSAIKITNQIKD